jgi:hypothetical protein
MREAFLNIVPIDLNRVTSPFDEGSALTRPGWELPDSRGMRFSANKRVPRRLSRPDRDGPEALAEQVSGKAVPKQPLALS